MDEALDALPLAGPGDIARAALMYIFVGDATLLHIGRDGIDDAICACNGRDDRLLVTDVCPH
jgi:hypothetical protein